MSMDDYCGLDFTGPEGLGKNLMASAGNGADSARRVRLTDNLGVYPAGLTPNMSDWYGRYVEPKRLGALADLAAEYGRVRVKGVAATMFEQRRDEIEQKRVNSSQRAIDNFHQRNNGLQRDVNEAEQLYRELYNAYDGREPIAPHPLLYWGGLLVIIALEVAINFESFRQMPYITSLFLATGATLIIALAFGFASHIHGTIWKQRKFQFGPAEYNRQKQGWWLFSIGSALLFFGISSVGAARYYYLVPVIQEAILTGSPPPSIPFSIGFMLLGNILVYLLGCVWAFMNHDEDPEYPKRKRRYDALSHLYKMRKARELSGHLAQVTAKAQEDTEKARNADKVMGQNPTYADVKKAVTRFQEQDANVLAVLSTYRNDLMGQVRGKDVVFELPTPSADDGLIDKRMTPEEYAGHAFKLKWITTTPEAVR